jgi:hypothetical protein
LQGGYCKKLFFWVGAFLSPIIARIFKNLQSSGLQLSGRWMCFFIKFVIKTELFDRILNFYAEKSTFWSKNRLFGPDNCRPEKVTYYCKNSTGFLASNRLAKRPLSYKRGVDARRRVTVARRRVAVATLAKKKPLGEDLFYLKNLYGSFRQTSPLKHAPWHLPQFTTYIHQLPNCFKTSGMDHQDRHTWKI